MVVKMVEGAFTFSTRTAARILALSPGRIRHWVRQRLVNPAVLRGRHYRFAFNDLLLMRMTKELLPSRRHLEPLRRAVKRARALGGPARPLTSLRLENDAGLILVRQGDLTFEAESGQLCLPFRGVRSYGKVEEGFGPARVRARFEEAKRLADSDPFRALRLYSELLGREPCNFELHMRLAELLENEGNLAGAVQRLLAAAVLVPANPEVHLRLGLAYRKSDADDNALQSFRRAVECDPLSVLAHRNLAELYEKMGSKCDALRHLSIVHRLNRNDP